MQVKEFALHLKHGKLLEGLGEGRFSLQFKVIIGLLDRKWVRRGQNGSHKTSPEAFVVASSLDQGNDSRDEREVHDLGRNQECLSGLKDELGMELKHVTKIKEWMDG